MQTVHDVLEYLGMNMGCVSECKLGSLSEWLFRIIWQEER